MKTVQMVLILAAIASVPATVMAQNGDRGGNGGDAVTRGAEVQLLDSQNSEDEGFPIRFDAQDDTLGKKVEALIQRVNNKDLNLGDKLGERARTILKDVEAFIADGKPQKDYVVSRFRDGELPNVPDEGATYVRPGWTIAQLVIRTPHPLPNQKEYSFRRDLLVQMIDAEIAATIFHEAVYGYLVDAKVNSSVAARWFNGLVISDRISTMTDKDLSTQMESFGFPDTRSGWRRVYQGFVFDPLSNVQYAADGSIQMIGMAHALPERQLPYIRGSNIKMDTWVFDLIFDHGKLLSFRPLVSMSLDSLQQEYGVTSSVSGGRKVWYSAREVRGAKRRNVVQLARLTYTATGATIQILRCHYRLDPLVLIPVFGSVDLIGGNVMLRKGCDLGVMELDLDGNILKTEWESHN